MELKRLLTRATALLLQGAYQGAESFIEQAMAEADKLKQELAEIDTLRTRVAEMAAEVERLQSVIDEANAQEPDAVACGAGEVYVKSDFYDIDSFLRNCRNNTPLYKRPIPAQQPPAVTVPENWNAQCTCGHRWYAVMPTESCPSCNPSPRITEEDALPKYYREEWRHHVMLMWSCVRKHDSSIPSDVLDYMREQLLNKINGDHNGK